MVALHNNNNVIPQPMYAGTSSRLMISGMCQHGSLYDLPYLAMTMEVELLLLQHALKQ